MNSHHNNLRDLVDSGIDFINIVISKEEVDARDYSGPLDILNQLISEVSIAQYFKERVDIGFDGYNNTSDELCEIPEVRNYIVELDSYFPFWLFFLSKECTGLYVVIKCFLLPYLAPEANRRLIGPKLREYLENRGFPAMNHLCEVVEISEMENIEMTNRLVQYLKNIV